MDSELKERIRIRCDETIPYIIHASSQFYKTSEYPLYYQRAVENIGNDEHVNEMNKEYAKLKQGNFKVFKFIDSLSHEVPIIYHSQQALLDLVEMMHWKVYMLNREENRLDPEWKNELHILFLLVQFRADILCIFKHKKQNLNAKNDHYTQEIPGSTDWMITMNFMHDIGAYLDELRETMIDDAPLPESIVAKTLPDLESYKNEIFNKFLRKANVTTITIMFQDYYAERICTKAERAIYFRRNHGKIPDKELLDRKNQGIFNLPDPGAISTVKDLWNWVYFDDFIMDYAYRQQHFGAEMKIKHNRLYQLVEYQQKFYFNLSEVCYKNNLLKFN